MIYSNDISYFRRPQPGWTGWTIEWPRLENEELIMAIGSTRPLEDATRIAYRELVLWMAKDYGFNKWDAYMIRTQGPGVRGFKLGAISCLLEITRV